MNANAKRAPLLTPQSYVFRFYKNCYEKLFALQARARVCGSRRSRPALCDVVTALRDGDRTVASHENAFIARHGVARVYCTWNKCEQSAVCTESQFSSGESSVAPAVTSLKTIIKGSRGRVVTGYTTG